MVEAAEVVNILGALTRWNARKDKQGAENRKPTNARPQILKSQEEKP